MFGYKLRDYIWGLRVQVFGLLLWLCSVQSIRDKP